MIINVQEKDFGGKLRNGDLVGMCNVLEYFRLQENNPNIKFYFPDEMVVEKEYGVKFLRFLKEHTDYFSVEKGELFLQSSDISVWEMRALSGDIVKIDNSVYTKQKKISIFPVFDAKYNTYRNWSVQLTNHIINKFKALYPGYNVFLCVSENNIPVLGHLDLTGVKVSFDFDANINHICESEIFVGGDTGTSHFAGSLSNPAKNYYYYAAEETLHTFPLHYKTTGEMIMYGKYGCLL